MFFSAGRIAARGLAADLATSFVRPVIFRGMTKSQSKALGIYRRYPQAVRGFVSAGRPKKASTSASEESGPTEKPKKKAVKTTKAKATARRKSKPTSEQSKPTSKQSKSKSKSKRKPKAAKKPISAEQRAVLKRRALKPAALLNKEPNREPTTAWQLFVREKMPYLVNGRFLPETMAELARDFKSLPSHEIQRLQSTVDENKLVNAASYKAWVESHPVPEIHAANMARKHLKRKFDHPKGPLKLIHDERLPKTPLSSFALFTKARWVSGDFSVGSLSLAEIAVKIGKEWKSLTPAERQPYEDLALSERDSYVKAMGGVLPDVRLKSRKSPSPAIS
ncbi:hypothetical protein F4802DRAFT_499420 [Xylaria palmicola]|nr:hypothetical protein F4802DRAFT_499420 [Xylaria palmicola]